MKYTSKYTLIDGAIAATTGTALDVSKISAYNAQVTIVNAATTPVTLTFQGSVDGTTYSAISGGAVTTVGTGSYFFGESLVPYKKIRPVTTSHASTAAVTVGVRLLS